MIIDHEEHPIERIMDNAFTKMRGLVTADTVIGNAVTTADGVTIIPVSRVTMGFLTAAASMRRARIFRSANTRSRAVAARACPSLPSAFW